MRRHMIFLDREEENVRQKKSICAQLEADGQQLSTMDTEKYLLLMEEMEKEGVRFMNVTHVDQKKKKAPIMAAVVMILLMIALIVVFIWGAIVEPIPIPILGILIAFPVVTIGGVLLALKERIKQIEGGEEDAASKY